MITIAPYSGGLFWLLTVAFIGFYLFIQKVRASVWSKNLFITLSSVLILFFTINMPGILLPMLFALCALVYCLGKSMAAATVNSAQKLFAIISLIVFFLCYFKYAIVQSTTNQMASLVMPVNYSKSTINNHLFFVGVSYFTFKFIHFLIECQKKKITDLNFLTFLSYIFFYPGFFSGPINRYNSFAKSVASQTKQGPNILEGSKRIVNGLFKKIVLGDFLFPYSIAALDLNGASQVDIAIGIYTYMFYIYFNFSGYTDMAIGCGKMVGIELPENFNYPFFKRNLQQFWANWHISLTAWLTDYIYWPLARKFRKVKKIRKKPVTISNICIVITFLICGLWHGDGLNFIIWGLYHGIGLAILNGYTQLIKKHSTQNIRKFVSKSPVAYGISNFITFQYVAFGFLLFACDVNRLKIISNVFL
jgi:alginate O-acetyltransferase complex protein AlgI